MQPTDPLYKLRFLLSQHKMHLIPADKTHQFALIPYDTYTQELHSHLADTNTYSHVTEAEVNEINISKPQVYYPPIRSHDIFFCSLN